jgi:ribosomal protein L15
VERRQGRSRLLIQGMSEIDQVMNLRVGRVDRAKTIRVYEFSFFARQRVESAGGKVEEVGAAEAA